MRKTSITLGLALFVGAAGTAAAQAQTPPDRAKAGAHRDHERPRGERGFRGRRGPGGEGFLLRGITLTDAQKTKLQELRKADANEANRERFRAVAQEARTLREKGDTAAARTKLQELATLVQREREQRMTAIRGLLTAEQLQQFDANVAAAKQRQAQRGEGARGPRGERGQRGRVGR